MLETLAIIFIFTGGFALGMITTVGVAYVWYNKIINNESITNIGVNTDDSISFNS